jgi:hypothetical protein
MCLLKLWLIILPVMISGCTDLKLDPVCDNSNDNDVENPCVYETLNVNDPQDPLSVDIPEIKKFTGDASDCKKLPEQVNGLIEIAEGCYAGCLNISGSFRISGKGSDKTLILCEDVSAQAAIWGKDVDLEIEGVTITSKTRGISVEGKSTIKIRNAVITDCVKGAVKGCVDGEDCFSDVVISDSLISEIKTVQDELVSYGVTIGRGNLQIINSKLEGFSSFAVAVWGESDLVIRNSEIKDIYGVSGDFHGVGIYAENSDIYLDRVSVSDSATSFIYMVNDRDLVSIADIRDVVLAGGKLQSEEQGGLILDGNINAEIARISISESRGNGIFGNGVTINGEDVDIRGVYSDLTTENGFGVVLFDSEAYLKNILISEAEKVGLLVDGSSNVVIDNFQISETKADAVIGEYGLGAAVQGGAFLSMENGVVAKNRECGVMAVNAELVMKNVEIVDTLPRKCIENENCTFAPGVPFGHGVSIYSDSKLSFGSLFINNNSNGINIEKSQVEKISEGKAFFIDNSCAVNAWDIDDEKNLETAFDDVTFCNNKSVFTTDVQPVREGL